MTIPFNWTDSDMQEMGLAVMEHQLSSLAEHCSIRRLYRV
jgi:hypothetical protein